MAFQWNAGTGMSNLYWLRVGTMGVGSYDISAAEYAGTSATVSGIPTNGGIVYVRLYSLSLASNTWISTDYTYTAANSSSGSLPLRLLALPVKPDDAMADQSYFGRLRSRRGLF